MVPPPATMPTMANGISAMTVTDGLICVISTMDTPMMISTVPNTA